MSPIKYVWHITIQKENNEEGNKIIQYSYSSSSVNENLVAIVCNFATGVQMGGLSSHLDSFYYDVEKDCEITFEEYLTGLSITLDDIKTALENDVAFEELQVYLVENYYEIGACSRGEKT